MNASHRFVVHPRSGAGQNEATHRISRIRTVLESLGNAALRRRSARWGIRGAGRKLGGGDQGQAAGSVFSRSLPVEVEPQLPATSQTPLWPRTR